MTIRHTSVFRARAVSRKEEPSAARVRGTSQVTPMFSSFSSVTAVLFVDFVDTPTAVRPGIRYTPRRTSVRLVVNFFDETYACKARIRLRKPEPRKEGQMG